MTSSRHHLVTLAALVLLPPLTSPAGAQEGSAARLTLGEAVRLAVTHHPRLRLARSAEAGARSVIGIAAAERFPQLAAHATLTRFEEQMIVAPLHGFDPTRPPTFAHSLTQGALSVTYTLFDGGARGARVAGARADARAAGASAAAAEADLIAEVARTYLQVLSARGVLDAQHQGVAALEAERRRVEALLAEGTAARVQLLRVAAALAEAEAARVSAAAALEVAERALARLIDADLGRARAPQLAAVRLADTLAEDRDDALARAMSANDRLAEARWRLQVVQGERRGAVAAWFPRFELVGGYLGFGSTSGDFTAEWQAGVRLTYPLFAGGARAHRVAAATAHSRAAEEGVRLAELETGQAVDRALSAVREMRARVVAQESAAAHLREVARIELLSLEAGAGIESDYLQAEAAFRRASAALVEARHGEIGARIELARLTGDLSSTWLATTLEPEP